MTHWHALCKRVFADLQLVGELCELPKITDRSLHDAQLTFDLSEPRVELHETAVKYLKLIQRFGQQRQTAVAFTVHLHNNQLPLKVSFTKHT